MHLILLVLPKLFAFIRDLLFLTQYGFGQEIAFLFLMINVVIFIPGITNNAITNELIKTDGILVNKIIYFNFLILIFSVINVLVMFWGQVNLLQLILLSVCAIFYTFLNTLIISKNVKHENKYIFLIDILINTLFIVYILLFDFTLDGLIACYLVGIFISLFFYQSNSIINKITGLKKSTLSKVSLMLKSTVLYFIISFVNMIDQWILIDLPEDLAKYNLSQRYIFLIASLSITYIVRKRYYEKIKVTGNLLINLIISMCFLILLLNLLSKIEVENIELIWGALQIVPYVILTIYILHMDTNKNFSIIILSASICYFLKYIYIYVSGLNYFTILISHAIYNLLLLLLIYYQIKKKKNSINIRCSNGS